MVIFVEVCRAEGHLRLPENCLLRMVSHLVVLNEQIPVLVLAMPTVHLLLQTFRWLLCSVGTVHQVVRVRHTMLTWLPGARIDA